MKSTDSMIADRKASFFCKIRRSAVSACIVMLQLLIMLTVGSFMGCGKKGPPNPPGREPVPVVVNDLNKTISGDKLILTWTSVAENSAAPKAVVGYYVYRSKRRLSESDCQNCPLIFQRVADIPFDRSRSGSRATHQFEYREPLENGYRYVYKVVGYSKSGATGRDSNTIDFTY